MIIYESESEDYLPRKTAYSRKTASLYLSSPEKRSILENISEIVRAAQRSDLEGENNGKEQDGRSQEGNSGASQ